MNNLNGLYTKIIIETDSDDPQLIAEVTDTEINPAPGYRVRLKPSEEN